MIYSQARNQLGTQGRDEFSERGPNFLNYVQHIFPWEAKNFLGCRSTTLRPPNYGPEYSLHFR